MQNSKTKFVFFGTPKLSTIVLEELKKKDLIPSLVVTASDKPSGRGMKMNSSPVKKWAEANNIPTIEPEVYDEEVIERLKAEKAEVFILVAYGKILPQNVIDISPKGILNVHPSLLPKFRGPSPVRTAILEDSKTTGVTVMLIDGKMDHGPILAQEEHTPEKWPPNAQELDTYLFERGGALLAEVLPQYLDETLLPKEQEHDSATYCKLFKKEDGLIDLNDDPHTNLLKIHAYAGWPGTHFYITKNDERVRLNIVEARLTGDKRLVFEKVIPEGKKEMSYIDFLQS